MDTLAQTEPHIAAIATPGRPVVPPSALRMAYLLSQYPAISHTFFLKEIAGLRARGVSIETASINRPDRPLEQLSPEEREESLQAAYIKDGNWPQALCRLFFLCLAHPVVLFRGLSAVLSLPRLAFLARLRWLFYLAEALLVGRWMRQRKLRHLHVHFGGPVASVGMLTALAWDIPFSLTIHGPEELLNTEAFHLREKLSAATFVCCISDFCRSQLCRLLSPDAWPSLHVIRLGVDPLLLTPSTPPFRSGLLSLVCTGRLVPEKGQHILLEALAALRDRGIHFQTTLIGAGPEANRLHQAALTFGLQESVTFTSALSHADTLSQIRAADIFVLPSFAEGIPVSLMEAMSFAVPCISTTVAGIPELIRSGQDGLLVPPANIAALADALEALHNSRSLRIALGDAGRQRVIADYNLPLNLERLSNCFQNHIAEVSIP